MSGLLPYNKPVGAVIYLTEAYLRYRAHALPPQSPDFPTESVERSASNGAELPSVAQLLELHCQTAAADPHAQLERKTFETFRVALEKHELIPLVSRDGGLYWHLASGWEGWTISLFLFPGKGINGHRYDTIDKEEYPHWEKAHGERPFVEEAAFEEWLNGGFSMASDVPEGYVSLKEAKDIYICDWYGGLVSSEQSDKADCTLVKAFVGRQLDAFVRRPVTNENIRLLPGDWEIHSWPERLFLAREIAGALPEKHAWNMFIGLTPFVLESAFRKWTSACVVAGRHEIDLKFDPFRKPSWTLAMAIAWISERSSDSVRLCWPEYRRESDGTDRYAGIGFMSPSKYEVLFQHAEAGKLQITGVNQQTRQPEPVPMEEWPYLELAYDTNLSARLDRKGSLGQLVRYRDLTVRSADILSLWKPDCSDPTFNGSQSRMLDGASSSADAETNGSGERRTKGRRPKYDWRAFLAEVRRKLEEEGEFAPSVDTEWIQARLEEHMLAWCQRAWRTEPGESTIRAKVAEVVTLFEKGRKSQK